MIFRSQMFNKVAIMGVGLMGGSLGMAMKKHRLAEHVIGVSAHASSLEEAVKNKAIDIGYTEIEKGVKEADLVILATPVDTILKLFALINPHLKRGCLVTDLGGTKSSIVEAAEKNLSNPSFFIGSHPLAGSEKQGVSFARPDLFEKSFCIVTPTAKTNPMAKEKIRYLWTKIGADVKFLSPEEHDEILAYISHLPHLIAYGLMEAIPKEFIPYAAQGLKDSTRIAASSPQVWSDICLNNSTNVLKSLDEFVKNLFHFRKAVVDQDDKSLIEHFTKAKEKREELK